MMSYYQHVRRKHNGIPLPDAPKIDLSKNNISKKV